MTFNGIMPRNMSKQTGQVLLRQGSEGQAGLIVLLVMVVVTTVAVSVSSRSVSELRISRQEQESTRTLNLAESGIEEILQQDLSTFSSTVNVAGTDIPYSITPQDTISNYELSQGHTLEIDVTGATALNLNWTGDPSIVVVLIESNGTLTREVFKKNSSPAGNIGIAQSLPYSYAFSGKVMARIKALYEPTLITVGRSGGTNPLYYKVTTTATLADGSTRAVSVNKFPGSLPSIFDYVLFSGTSLTK
jgi:Tfp pilus assembly protein PilX